MSDERVPDAVFLRRLPKKTGKKSVKFELFLASQFEAAWSHLHTKEFSPTVPINIKLRREYWKKELYRIRKNEKWVCDYGRYTFFNFTEAMELLQVIR